MMQDEYGLYIDPEGDFTQTADYTSADPSTYAVLDSSDPNYVPDLDTSIDDGPNPKPPNFQKKYRIRLRWKRWKIKQYNVAEWQNILQEFKGNESAVAVAEMQAYWLAAQLGFPQ